MLTDEEVLVPLIHEPRRKGAYRPAIRDRVRELRALLCDPTRINLGDRVLKLLPDGRETQPKNHERGTVMAAYYDQLGAVQYSVQWDGQSAESWWPLERMVTTGSVKGETRRERDGSYYFEPSE